MTKEYVLDAISKLKASRDEDERQVRQLVETRKRAEKAGDMYMTLSSHWQDVVGSLREARDLQDKRLGLEAVQVSIAAAPGSYKVTCAIDADLTPESSGLFRRFSEKRERLWEERPDLFPDRTLTSELFFPRSDGKTLDLAVHDRIPEPLVTTEQTSA